MLLASLAHAASFLTAALSLTAVAFILEKLSDRRSNLDELRKEALLQRYNAPMPMAALRSRCTGGGILAGFVIVVLTQNVVFAILVAAAGLLFLVWGWDWLFRTLVVLHIGLILYLVFRPVF